MQGETDGIAGSENSHIADTISLTTTQVIDRYPLAQVMWNDIYSYGIIIVVISKLLLQGTLFHVEF